MFDLCLLSPPTPIQADNTMGFVPGALIAVLSPHVLDETLKAELAQEVARKLPVLACCRVLVGEIEEDGAGEVDVW